MLIIPAIDIKDGSVVRLVQGDFKNEKVYSYSPVDAAKHWAGLGAKLIHIVDLDGARTGLQKNLALIKEIVSNCRIPVELGGGIRDIQAIQDSLEAGVSRVVLGTKAAEDRDFLRLAFSKFKDKVIVSIDARQGKVMTKGWGQAASGVDALEMAKDLKEIGFSEVIYTDISKDGMLKGPDISGITGLIKESGLKVIGSGGISSLDDLRLMKPLEKQGLVGVIIGKALYEGNFTLPEALKIG